MTTTLEPPTLGPDLPDPDAPEHENDTQPPDWWYDEVVVARGVAGRWDLISRELSLAEQLAVLGPAMDAWDEAVRAGRRQADHPNGLDSLARRFGWSAPRRRKMMKLARPDRVVPERGKTWEKISHGRPSTARRRWAAL